jgi:hypothetical protein
VCKELEKEGYCIRRRMLSLIIILLGRDEIGVKLQVFTAGRKRHTLSQRFENKKFIWEVISGSPRVRKRDRKEKERTKCVLPFNNH